MGQGDFSHGSPGGEGFLGDLGHGIFRCLRFKMVLSLQEG